ncbi:hypothetical protein IJ425_07200 [bacterium]|nr:hypothetical protein [bacterium]
MKIVNINIKNSKLNSLSFSLSIKFVSKIEMFEELDFVDFYNGIVNLLNHTSCDVFEMQLDYFDMPIIFMLKRINEDNFQFVRFYSDKENMKYDLDKNTLKLFINEFKDKVTVELKKHYTIEEIENYYKNNLEDLM